MEKWLDPESYINFLNEKLRESDEEVKSSKQLSKILLSTVQRLSDYCNITQNDLISIFVKAFRDTTTDKMESSLLQK